MNHTTIPTHAITANITDREFRTYAAAKTHQHNPDFTITDIARQLGLSTNTIRENFVNLKKQGLIKATRNRRPDGTLGRCRYTFPTTPETGQ